MTGPVLVLHATEGTSLAGARRTMAANRSMSHWLGDPATGEFEQLVSPTGAARSLRNMTGGVETNNRGRVFQLEIVGRAAEVPTYNDQWYRTLAEWVIGLCERHNIPRRFPHPFAGNEAYGLRGRVRMSNAEWLACSGIVGHQHVPENTHWDPGDISRLIPLVTPKENSIVNEHQAAAQAAINGWLEPVRQIRVDGDWGPTSTAALKYVLDAVAAPQIRQLTEELTAAMATNEALHARVADLEAVTPAPAPLAPVDARTAVMAAIGDSTARWVQTVTDELRRLDTSTTEGS